MKGYVGSLIKKTRFQGISVFYFKKTQGSLLIGISLFLLGCQTTPMPKDSVSTEAVNRLSGDEVISMITYVSPKVIDPLMVHSGTGGIIEFAMLASMQSRESIAEVVYRCDLDDPALNLTGKIQDALQQKGFTTVHRKVRQPLPLTETFNPYQKAFPNDLILEIAVPAFSFTYNGFAKSYTNVHKSVARLINPASMEIVFVTTCSRRSATVNEKRLVENDAEILRSELTDVVDQCADQLARAINNNLKF